MRRKILGALAAGLAAALVAVGGGTASADSDFLWNGFGRGSTPEKAIRKAIQDVEIMASGEGFFHCELVGEPIIFPPGTWGPNDLSWSAGVDMICE